MRRRSNALLLIAFGSLFAAIAASACGSDEPGGASGADASIDHETVHAEAGSQEAQPHDAKRDAVEDVTRGRGRDAESDGARDAESDADASPRCIPLAADAAVVEYAVAAPDGGQEGGSQPFEIVRGPDGNMWFTDLAAQDIVRASPTGVMERFAIPTANSAPSGIAVGPDGAVWFAETGSGKIARVEADGGIEEFAIPPLSDGGTSGPFDLTAGPDGNLWVTLLDANSIARVTTAGQVTEFPLPPDAGSDLSPYVIVAAPDGNLWFTSFARGVVSRITPDGVVSFFPASERSFGITVGPDGALWFAMQGKIGRITPVASPTVTEFSVTGFGGAGIVAGPDCESVYADDFLGNRIRRFVPPLTDAGPDADLVFTDFDLPTPNSNPQSIARGPEGSIWFGEIGSGKVGFLR